MSVLLRQPISFQHSLMASVSLLWTPKACLHSDRTRERGYHVMFSAAASCIGYIILAIWSQGASYFALFLVIGGSFSLFSLVMGWATNVLSPMSKRGVGTAFIVSMANCVSIAAPQIYFDASDRFRKAHGIAAGYVTIMDLAVMRLKLLNRRKEKIHGNTSKHEKDNVVEEFDAFHELPDSDPNTT
ncbi:hypothetical protein M422DRAFT_50687 [Sphaerobolus stellatus SS14]|uniref:Uncharacterized protein n=1 Tax=Sphaerobolus stellatus (strain SS14) TaxID=990650 RepID=A0A0C9U2L3_SPHS4|nr:hypothetical protein M422DRAFT_50687 [Sphaerobolus stellatus SS14]